MGLSRVENRAIRRAAGKDLPERVGGHFPGQIGPASWRRHTGSQQAATFDRAEFSRLTTYSLPQSRSWLPAHQATKLMASAVLRDEAPSVRIGPAEFVSIPQVINTINEMRGGSLSARGKLRSTIIVDTHLRPVDDYADVNELLRTFDHRDHLETPDGKNSTMKLLDEMERLLAKNDGDVSKALQALNFKYVSTDNLADAGWCLWIGANQERVLKDADLRQLIRQATKFEDYLAFGKQYDREDPAVELQAAIFFAYNEILSQIKNFTHDRILMADPQQVKAVMTKAILAIDQVVHDKAMRKANAKKFWKEVDVFVAKKLSVARLRSNRLSPEIAYFNQSYFDRVPVFIQWLGMASAHDRNLQVGFKKIPNAFRTEKGVAVSGNAFFIAIPNGKRLPSGLGMTSIREAINRKENARRKDLGLPAVDKLIWQAKENVLFAPFPPSVLTVEEVNEILTNPENKLFVPA